MRSATDAPGRGEPIAVRVCVARRAALELTAAVQADEPARSAEEDLIPLHSRGGAVEREHRGERSGPAADRARVTRFGPVAGDRPVAVDDHDVVGVSDTG